MFPFAKQTRLDTSLTSKDLMVLFKCMHKKTVKSACILTTSYIYICMCVLHFLCHILSHMYQIMCEYVCVYLWIVLNVCNCTHERTNKIPCILIKRENCLSISFIAYLQLKPNLLWEGWGGGCLRVYIMLDTEEDLSEGKKREGGRHDSMPILHITFALVTLLLIVITYCKHSIMWPDMVITIFGKN